LFPSVSDESSKDSRITCVFDCRHHIDPDGGVRGRAGVDVDELDRKIVDVLVRNGRLSHEQIAKEVHLSRPAVFERIKRLEAKAVIRGYGARIDWEAVGLPLVALVWIRTSNLDCSNLGRQIAELKFEGGFLEELFRITGDWCMFAQYRLASPSALQRVIDRIRQVPGVQNTMTSIALSALEEIMVS
jgi:Lrp/AsnC family leucine-responsive transcriptional regulator